MDHKHTKITRVRPAGLTEVVGVLCSRTRHHDSRQQAIIIIITKFPEEKLLPHKLSSPIDGGYLL